jgi:hypothetical protein
MAGDHLATYLNDHLAGSVAAIKLLEYLEHARKNSPDCVLFADLKADVAADRDELKAIMSKLGVAESRPRKVAGWLTERITQLKLRLDDLSGESLRQLEAIEIVAIGIEGKRALWGSLVAAAEATHKLQGIDYERLARRAKDQRCRIETARLRTARKALVGDREKP